ncbi:flagellar hook-length control protein FliK [Oceanobacillus sp. Castelsardo]|uniref:flagellar hook-length control protein FliK n=1 Tax=Oceanobacillus sp. Castelsardo TaxID=1851204 RepID=UPI000837D488|nr:flagellar hook-length control protein FliK [Oceanobacillus sp. Castelsardo]
MNAVGTYIPLSVKVSEQMNQGNLTVSENLSFEQILNNQELVMNENQKKRVDSYFTTDHEMVINLSQSIDKIREQNQTINDQLTMLLDNISEDTETFDQVLITDIAQLINQIEEQTQDINNQLAMLMNNISENTETVDQVSKNNVLQLFNKIEEQIQDINNQLAVLLDNISENAETVDQVSKSNVLQLLNKIEEQTQNINNQLSALFDNDKTYLTRNSPFIMPTENGSTLIDHLNSNELIQVTSSIKDEVRAEHKNILKDIILNFNNLITQLNNTDDLSKISPKVLELLKNYLKLDKTGQYLTSNLQQNNVNNKEQLIWQDLIDFFSKRENLSIKQQYNVHSEVTSKDVTNWLIKSLEKHSLSEPVTTNQIHTGTPLSKIEQYVIHLNNNQETSKVNQQLIKQFESIIKTSRFLASPNGTNQLSIILNPENLGQIRIKLVQMNGEMTVKMVVSTQVAKDMLESNMGQLRNMFLPHQVIIEKQELPTQGNMMQKDPSSNQQWEGEGEQHSSHSNQEGNESSSDETELSFNDLLMNVKV